MGVVSVEHMGGATHYCCSGCYTNLTNKDQLISTHFTSASGRAFLFSKAVNVKCSGMEVRIMTTGRHIVRDVSCKNCDKRLGWMYEFAHEKAQEYKEGKFIFERAYIKSCKGINETVMRVHRSVS